MKLKSITLRWFRGATADNVLPLDGKCTLVYGRNGSGKSSFVDAVEHVINKGVIGHLQHEYAGSHQEKGVINTHRRDAEEASYTLLLGDDTKAHCRFRPNGSPDFSGDGLSAVRSWDYRRTVLRQDQVAEFINRTTKGGKYSALLPIIGLDSLEVCAENVHQLIAKVENKAGLFGLQQTIDAAVAPRSAAFGNVTIEEVVDVIKALHKTHCPEGKGATTAARCDEIAAAVASRVSSFTAESSRYLTLLAIAGSPIANAVSGVREANAAAASATEPLMTHRLGVLTAADSFAAALPEEGSVTCPACGVEISTEDLRTHVEVEKLRLQDALSKHSARRSAINSLVGVVRTLRTDVEKEFAKPWRESLADDAKAALSRLKKLDIDALSKDCTEADLKFLDDGATLLVASAATASTAAPAAPVELNTAQAQVSACRLMLAAAAARARYEQCDGLIGFLQQLEKEIRREIRRLAQKLIDDISEDVRDMWDVLHPESKIRGVSLYLSPDHDKAIDIGLLFHGVEQASPRLTLSEGFRNALGLCLFLAIAKRETGAADRPLILDDVVISLDREHRGSVIDLLKKKFPDRQLVVFTHDREWYRELRPMLPKWNLRSLLAYDNPREGIRWSTRVLELAEAHEVLSDHPEMAMQRARAAMDTELSVYAEELRLLLPYLRYEKNDARHAKEFLDEITSKVKKGHLQRRMSDGGLEPHPDALGALADVDALMLAWANRDSHTVDEGYKTEASRFIVACQKTLDLFRCSSDACGEKVWAWHKRGETQMKCGCGGITWKVP